MSCTPTLCHDFYSLLHIPGDASPTDIKIAYHRTLLRLHPDKQPRLRTHPDMDDDPDTTIPTQTRHLEEEPVDIALLKEAYKTLSDADLRAAYDGSLRREERARSHRPRPAQVVSLGEFTTIEMETEMETGTVTVQGWRYTCRCGGMYRITEDDLESGTHLVGCESCSEVIWVGYEEAVTEDE